MKHAHPLTYASPFSALLTVATEKHTVLKFEKKKEKKRKIAKEYFMCFTLFVECNISNWVRLLEKS